jgi:glutathione reductase (NADPH)
VRNGDFDLFVLGGGSGGVRCARIAASLGARVAVAEARAWGGTCVNRGCVPKKLLVMAAEYGLASADAHGFGWRGEAPRCDWPALIAAMQQEVARHARGYGELLRQAGCIGIEASARLLGPREVEVAGRRLRAERIVLATGGVPVRPSIPGAEYLLVSDDLFTLPALPARVVVWGGGYIAVEFASLLAGLGAEVALVYRQPLPLRGFDADLRSGLAEALAAAGVRLYAESTLAAVTAAGGERLVQLADGSVLSADAVFAAVGRRPNTADLGLTAAGVTLDGAGAVVVDGQNETTAPGIYAVGDVTNRLRLTPVATAEGHALAERLFGAGRPDFNREAVPTAVFSSPPLATVGRTEAEAAARGPTDVYLSRFTPLRHNLTGRKRQTLVKLVVCGRSNRVLGAHMLGDDAPEIVQGLAVAMTAGATKADFDRTIGIHPTAAEEFVTLRRRTRALAGG